MKGADDDSASYADRTRNDPNPIKRVIQRDRFLEPIKLITSATAASSVLDYGAGDGELMRRLAPVLGAGSSLIAYEPSPAMHPALEDNLSGSTGVNIATTLSETAGQTFDWILCLEVLEHIPEARIDTVLDSIGNMTHRDSRVLIAVPMEIHLPAFLKGLFRMTRRWGAPDARIGNVLRAALGADIPRPLSNMGDGLPYHFEHIGFDYRVLERRLERRFKVIRRWCRPMPLLGRLLNSEIYFLLAPKPPTSPS